MCDSTEYLDLKGELNSVVLGTKPDNVYWLVLGDYKWPINKHKSLNKKLKYICLSAKKSM